MRLIHTILGIFTWIINTAQHRRSVDKERLNADLARAIRNGDTEEIARQWRRRQH